MNNIKCARGSRLGGLTWARRGLGRPMGRQFAGRGDASWSLCLFLRSNVGQGRRPEDPFDSNASPKSLFLRSFQTSPLSPVEVRNVRFSFSSFPSSQSHCPILRLFPKRQCVTFLCLHHSPPQPLPFTFVPFRSVLDTVAEGILIRCRSHLVTPLLKSLLVDPWGTINKTQASLRDLQIPPLSSPHSLGSSHPGLFSVLLML